MTDCQHRKTMLIWAPQFGAVVDYNIYCESEKGRAIQRLVLELRKAGAFFRKDANKAIVEALSVRRLSSGLVRLKLLLDGAEMAPLTFDLPCKTVDVTLGGVAYNIYEDLLAMTQAIDPFLKIHAEIGVPTRYCESNSGLIPGQPRRSVMFVPQRGEAINVVGRRLRIGPGIAPLPKDVDVAMLTSYAPEEIDTVRANVMYLRRANPRMRLYMCPGSTQIRMGADSFRDVLAGCECICIQEQEALTFFDASNLNACIRKAKRFQIRNMIVTNSERGAHLFVGECSIDAKPYSVRTITRAIRRASLTSRGRFSWPNRFWRHGSLRKNYSGCGDMVMAAYAFLNEQTVATLDIETRVSVAMAFGCLVSLLPESNLRNVSPTLVKEVYELACGGDFTG